MPSLNIQWVPMKEMLCDEQLLSAISIWLDRRYEMMFSDFIKIVNNELSSGLPVAVQFINKYFPWNTDDNNADYYTTCLVTVLTKLRLIL